MATGSGMRISDADREAAASGLREHYAQGRLTLDEFQQRLDGVFAAKTDLDLARITGDLPHVTAYPASWQSPQRFAQPARNLSHPPFPPRGTGQGHSRRQRTRRGTLAGTLLLVLAMVLLISLLWPLSLFGWLVPKPVLILVAILVFAKRVFRRLLGGTMRPRGRR